MSDQSTHFFSLRMPIRLLVRVLIISVPFGLFFGLLNSGHGPFWEVFLACYAFSIAIGLTISAFVRFAEWISCRLGTDERPRGKRLAIDIAIFGTAAMIGSQIPFILAGRIFHIPFYGSLRQALINVGFSVIFTVLFMGVIYARLFYIDLREKEKAEERARTALARAELRALRAQIHPHFLFNTLNTIAALIPTEPTVAEEVTTRLAEVFRFVLASSERDVIPLSEELEFVRAYLDIERVRLGERLRVEESIDAASLIVPVPALLLQPLVENAVRHGLGGRASGGTVRLSSSIANGTLTLSVADDGVGFDVTTRGGRAGQGFGLRSAEDRVRALGDGAHFTIRSEPGSGTEITIALPLTDHA